MAEPARGPIPLWAGRLVEPVYAAAIDRRNRRFDAGRGVTRLDVPVISVGNLSVGGTGKTPMVMHVLGLLLRAGRRPCVAMRGYQRGRPTDGRLPDETDSYRRRFPDVPIVAQPDRLAGLRALMQAAGVDGPDCVVLDDGFQHRRLARDADLVLIDATRPPSADRLLPAGWLREPIRSLARATSVIVTHAQCATPEDLASIDAAVRAQRSDRRGVDAVTRHVWTGLLAGTPGVDETPAPLDVLAGARVLGCCAIGNPGAFLHSLRATVGPGGGGVVEAMTLPDHDPYAPATLDRLIARARAAKADAIVVTDKDWSKLRHVPADRWPCPVWRPVLELVFDRGADALEADIARALAARPRLGC